MSENRRKQKDRQIIGPCKRNKITGEQEGDGDTNRSWCTWNGGKSLRRMTGGIGNRRKDRYHPDFSIIEIGQNTERSPGDPRRLAVTQIPVKDHQITLV